MPKVNVYLPDSLADAVRDAQLPVSAICQAALERAVRDVTSVRAAAEAPGADDPGVGLFGRFTPRARGALALAEDAARAVAHKGVNTEHLLLGVIDEGENLALRVLGLLDVEAADVRAEVIASMPKTGGRGGDNLPFTPLAKKALELTANEAHSLGHNYVGCEHLLLGLLATEEGLASQVLRRMGLELRTTRRAVLTALAGVVHARTPVTPPASEGAFEQILRRLDAIERRLGD
ncbi:MAG: ATP-dependent Clp protease ATP-binding subunit [Actinobacteria bacterium]|nr:ATP-dependent Clp protease ATP-binding subunit [Actinomycetota bacterium]